MPHDATWQILHDEIFFRESMFYLLHWLLFFPMLNREWPCIKRRLKIDLLVQVQGNHFWLGRDKQPAQEDLIRATFNPPQQGRQVLSSEQKNSLHSEHTSVTYDDISGNSASLFFVSFMLIFSCFSLEDFLSPVSIF